MKETIFKYMLLALLGVTLFIVCSEWAYIERGYTALGGELLTLGLPVAVSFIYDTAKHDSEQEDKD